MTYAAMVLAMNEADLLRACLAQFPAWVSKVLVLVSEYPWKGPHLRQYGPVEVFLKACREPRVEWHVMNWRTEQEQRNWGLGRLYDFDWVLVVDADEFYTPSDWAKMKSGLDSADASADGAIVWRMETYWKTPEWRYSPRDDHRPVVGVRPKRSVFFDKRDLVDGLRLELPVVLHHLSWVRSDADVLLKIGAWMHADDFDREAWYREKWLGWTPDTKAIHPYSSKPTVAVREPCPGEILAYLGR